MSELSITEYLKKDTVVNNISSVLKDRTPQFITSVVSLVNTNEKLAIADRRSLLNACLVSAALDLPINQNLGYAYIIPYRDSKTGITFAQFQMGYKGFVQLALRSKQFQTLNVTDIREGEIKEFDRLSGEIKFDWADENEREKLKIIGFIAYFRLLNGFSKQLYMTVEELKKHGVRFSQTYKKGFGMWKDDFDAMAKKTVLKLLISKFAPMTTEMTKATEADQALVKDDGFEYIDNKKQTSEDVAEEKERKRIKEHIENSKTLQQLMLCEIAVNRDDELMGLFIKKRHELSIDQNE